MDKSLPQSFYGYSISPHVCPPKYPIIDKKQNCNLKTCANPFQPFNGGTAEFHSND